MEPPKFVVKEGLQGGQTIKVPTSLLQQWSLHFQKMPNLVTRTLLMCENGLPPKGFRTWRDYTEGRIITQYKFEEGPSGVVLEEGKDLKGNVRVFISEVVPEGAASKFGTLRVNDTIDSIKEMTMVGKPFNSVMQTLVSQPRPTMISFASTNAPVITPEHTIVSFGEGALGIEFIEYQNRDKELAVKISKITDGSAASKYK